MLFSIGIAHVPIEQNRNSRKIACCSLTNHASKLWRISISICILLQAPGAIIAIILAHPWHEKHNQAGSSPQCVNTLLLVASCCSLPLASWRQSFGKFTVPKSTTSQKDIGISYSILAFFWILQRSKVNQRTGCFTFSVKLPLAISWAK
jgi:hypothetical protein